MFLDSNTLSFEQFEGLYLQENDENMELKSINEGEVNEDAVDEMIKAIRTFDRHGTGFINVSELKYSTSKMRGIVHFKTFL